MQKGKISWCLKQKSGIELIERSPHLAKSYMEEADDTLDNMFLVTGKWKLITAYYACYSAFYSILMQCGIKSEIHSCTIELMSLFNFSNESIEKMSILKEQRILAQYYLKKVELESEKDVKKFVIECKSIQNNLTSKDIKDIRNKIIILKGEK